MKYVLVFPGQGAQAVGMGRDFYDNFKVAKETFQEVDDILNKKLSKIIFEGPEEDLNSTINTQPALMATSIAMLRVLLSETGYKASDIFTISAGHSLGEYSSLCAIGAIDLATTAKLLEIRAKSMQEACPPSIGSMAAILGMEINQIEEILSSINPKLGKAEIANDNCPGQVVISGHNEAIDSTIEKVKEFGKKAIKLKVSAPFHSSLVYEASNKMKEALENINILDPQISLIQNFTASFVSDPLKIKHNLVEQVSGRVRWRETMDLIAKEGQENILEIGSGKVLSGLFKKSGHEFNINNISNIEELSTFIESLK